MVNLHYYFVFGTHFLGSLPNSLHRFTFVPSCLLYIQLSHNSKKSYKFEFVQFMIYETKKRLGEIERRLNTMNNNKMTIVIVFAC